MFGKPIDLKKESPLTKEEREEINQLLNLNQDYDPDRASFEDTRRVETIEAEEEAQVYYSLDRIKDQDCKWNLIYGKRGNGKTYAVLMEILKNYWENGEQGVYLRRYREDIQGKRGDLLWEAINQNGEVSKITEGKWDYVYHYAQRFYLAKGNGKDRQRETDPFCFSMSLSGVEHDKGTSYPLVTTVFFDEFLTRDRYLTDEFMVLSNQLSTIIRNRDNVTIFMCANTVAYEAPYWREFGMTRHIREQKPGTIDIYEFNSGHGTLRLAAEYTADTSKESKKSAIYFAFDNPQLKMITGGDGGHSWQLMFAPRLPIRYKPKDVVLDFFLLYEGDILHGEVVSPDGMVFVYLHRKTTPLQDESKDLIFSMKGDPRPNWNKGFKYSKVPVVKKLLELYLQGLFYYQDNEVYEIFRSYLIATNDIKN